MLKYMASKEKVKEKQSSNYNETLHHNGGSNTEIGTLPPGYKFVPEDDELIVHYLRPKVNKQRLPPNKMHEVQIYNPQKAEECNPEQLTANYEPQGEAVWYFFTSTYQKYPNGGRPNRLSGGGFWKASGSYVPITFNGDVVGYKRALTFIRGKKPFIQKTNWLMQEFRLNPDQSNKPQHPKARKSTIDKLDEWVLCKIYYGKGGNRENDGTKQEQTRKCESSTAKPKPESNIMLLPPQLVVLDTHKVHQNHICDLTIMDDVTVNDHNLVTKRSQFVGQPSPYTHWSGMTGMPSTSGGFHGYCESADSPIMDDPSPPTKCAIWDSTNATLKEVKFTDNCNMKTMPLQHNPSVMDDFTCGAWVASHPNNSNTIFEIGNTSSFMENDGANTCNLGSSLMVDAQLSLPDFGLEFDNGLLEDLDMFDFSFL